MRRLAASSALTAAAVGRCRQPEGAVHPPTPVQVQAALNFWEARATFEKVLETGE